MIHIIFIVIAWIGIVGVIATIPDLKDYVKKSDVVSVFKNREWQGNSFFNNNVKVVDTEGNDVFYPRKDVDESIDALNKLLTK